MAKRKNRRSSRRKAQTQGRNLKLSFMVGAVTLGFGAMGYLTLQAASQPVADVNGCYNEFEAAKTVVWVDVSAPRWSDAQQSSLYNYFERTYQNLGVNERLEVYTSESDQANAVVKPRFSVCGQASNAQELVAVGLPKAQAGYLAKQKRALYTDVFKPELDDLLSKAPANNQRTAYSSPIWEMTAAVVRDSGLEKGDTLVLVSDMIQNSESWQMCAHKGSLPAFDNFKHRAHYQSRFKLKDINGVQVELLMLQRSAYGDYCHEEEIADFYRGYFFDANAADVEVIRLRQGMGG